MFYVKHEMIVMCLSLQSVDLTQSSLSMEASDSEDDQVTQAHTNHTPRIRNAWMVCGRLVLKGQFTKNDHHLFIILYFQTCITFVHLLNTKEDIFHET